MDINQVLNEYDNMYGVNTLEEIGAFLERKLEEAYEEKDHFSAVTLLNEIIGFCRDTSQNEKGLKYCAQDLELMKKMGLEGSVEYATSLINVANAYRAFGRWDEAEELFEETEKIYREKLPAGEFGYANLYNNWSLLYQETQDFESAADMLEKALHVVEAYPDAKIKLATTHCNLAVTLLHLSRQQGFKGGYKKKDTTQHKEEGRQSGNAAKGQAAEEEWSGNEKGKGTHEKARSTYDRAVTHLNQALAIHKEDGEQDFHYSGVLSAMGDALYLDRDYDGAVAYYEKALKELERTVGHSQAYVRVEENLAEARKLAKKDPETGEGLESSAEEQQSGKKYASEHNLDRCRKFYQEYGAPMIHEKFPEYEDRIAVGMVGEGSDCFGFDDAISRDHDFGIGFCMWLTKEDYEKIGALLQKEYDRLITEYHDSRGYGEDSIELFLKKRRGVFTIDGFYEELFYGDMLCKPTDNLSQVTAPGQFKLKYDVWRQPEHFLAAAANGEVFRDDLGEFTAIRKELQAYYPEDIWKRRIADKLHEFSQYAQSNYARMMAREDYVTAKICVAEGLKAAMELCYLLDRTFAPYYKWQRKGLEKLAGSTEMQEKPAENGTDAVGVMSGKAYIRRITQLLDEISRLPLQEDAWKDAVYDPGQINRKDDIIAAFEKMAEIFSKEMENQGLVRGTVSIGRQAPFLENYIREVLAMPREECIEKIIALEWKQFDKVKNEGGRADCQDNWNTFSIMRRSQYLRWTEELLASYYQDLTDAEAKGWNLIMEKYARMMQSTAPEKYAELEKDLPVRDQDRIAIQEEIIKIQVGWMEEFAAKYPKMAGNARIIHTSEDTPYDTSYETYLRGELGTYSENTLILYGRFIVSLQQSDRNLAYEIMNQTAMLYGYESVEDAENRL